MGLWKHQEVNVETNESEEVACSTQRLLPSVNKGRLSSEGNHLRVHKETGHAKLLEKGILCLLARSVKGKLL